MIITFPLVEDSSENLDENEIVGEPIDEPTNNADTTNEDVDDSNSTIEFIPIESKQISNDVVVNTKNISEKTPNTNDNQIKETKIIKEKILPNKIKKENNLTVEDVELGKLLNQIKLECDSSIYIDTISYYDGMGPALYRLCQFDSSLNFFNESLVDNPNDVEILVNKGSTLGKLGYYSEAIVYYDHAISIDPNFLPAKNNKANALVNLGNYNDAVFLYDEILEQNPNYLTTRQNLEIVLSSNFDIDRTTSLSNVENTSDSKSSLSKNTTISDSEKLKSSNFFDEVGIAFSSLGSLFDFLN